MRPNRAPRRSALSRSPGLAAAVAALLLAGAAVAQDAPAPDAGAIRSGLQALEVRIAAARTSDALTPLRSQAVDLQTQADKAAAVADAALKDADARLAPLGPPAASEDPAIARLRRGLQARHDAADADAKRAKLLSLTAAQAIDDVADRQRELFNARILRRTDSPLTPVFWTGLGGSLPPDLDRIGRTAQDAFATARKAPEPHAGLALGGGLLLAALLLWPLRMLAGRLTQRRVIADIPPSPLRRSTYALGTLLLDALLPLAAAGGLALAAKWSGALSAKAAALADSAVLAVGWGALVAGLGQALLRTDAPSWRLAPISDRTAARLRSLPYAVAVTTMAGLLLLSLDRVVGASLSATVATHCAISLVYCALAAVALVLLGLGREGSDADEDARRERRASSGWSLVAVAVALAIAASLTATLAGYAVLGALIAGQIYWIGLLAGLAYLLLTFVDDLCGTIFAPGGWAARPLVVVFGLRRSTVDQLGVLTSAAVRLVMLAGFLSVAFTPFGRGAHNTLSQTLSAARVVRIGTLTISPGALLGGFFSLAVGVALVRAVQRWLDRRYLPATDWDVGVRNSVSTVVGYLGIGLAVFWALASAGLGLEKVALIASALSVGIGFGLQQIVQNFVSGLILLAERPIKVGDWVSVGGVEGDVRNIRVRATEIQMLDRSTVLVPNSELVTKTVQNKTLHAPHGRAELLLSIGDPTRAAEAREAILRVFDRHDGVLCDPEPRVFIDSVANGAVAFKGFAYVDGPRDAYATRSQLYFEVLAALAAKGIGLAGATQSLVIEPGEELRRALAARADGAATPPTRRVAKPSASPGDVPSGREAT